MNIISNLQLYKRHWIGILFITTLSTIVAVTVVATKDPSTHEATIFLSIGTKQTNNVSTSFDDVQAADRFTETVQGWFKNPDLLHRIEKATGQTVNLSARKQEKQNLIVSAPAIGENQATVIANTTIEQLRNDITQYNAETDSHYTLALTSITIEEQKAKLLIFGVVGFIFGLTFAIGLAHLWQFLRKLS